ncbi:TetR/AcrR family transcriptional regulator [Viridibacillus sp. FSL R5-0477]|uniref:Putative HTH-type transcriptional regulator arpR n=1 Tax=Viridibacillus arenosi FSL R5-213 TaxID=1227360 RepID=W4F033_9BACL|nr:MULTISPECIES: TetR/AcrR family transcriptional regulator [Viridibacillus]ETT86208.1 putative HTH-type transcriptional regulator arpR [Viridibacillus arenosi FSL R5-213]OMC84887.1 TetR family transcriptional regulator [Viridibacillus sp. FSL H8-0123]OMC91936.1 TetR family transcriptional regulator [Viridibacillus arenosi]
MDQSRELTNIQTQDKRKQERKQQLLSIALEMFATQGYDNTKISDIVAKANVSQGTFYWYFKSKEMIASEMLNDGRLAILHTISMGYRVEKASVQDAYISSRNLFEQLFHFAGKNRYFMGILLKGIHSQPILQQQVELIKKEMQEAFANNIRRASALKMLPRPVDPVLHSVFVMSLLEGVLSRWLFQSENEEWQQLELEQLVEKTVQFEFFGLFGM